MHRMTRSGWILLLLMMLAAAACRKPTLIGDDLIPPDDYLYSERQDTFSVFTTVLRDDSAVTSNNLFFPLGSLDEEEVGRSTASLYMQVNLPTNNLFLGNNPVLDSLVLVLDYAGLYGDSMAQHSFNVYKVIEPLYASKLYYSDSKVLTLPAAIGRKANFVPNLKDSVTVLGNTMPPQLRIRLTDQLGTEFTEGDTLKFLNDTTFTNFLNGLVVQPDTSGGHSSSMIIVNPYDANSGLTLYYHTDDADSLTAKFPFSGPKFGSYTHDYSGTPVWNYLTTDAPAAGDSVLFLQGLQGLKTKVSIPYIDSLEGIAINKAEIVFPLRSGEPDSLYPFPGRLQFIEGDTLDHNSFFYIDYNSETFISVVDQDFLFSGINYDYGGTLDTVINKFGVSIPAYRFNITRHLQKILQGEIDNDGFMLIVYPGYRIPNHVTLYGTGAADENLKPYLSITYTTINQ